MLTGYIIKYLHDRRCDTEVTQKLHKYDVHCVDQCFLVTTWIDIIQSDTHV